MQSGTNLRAGQNSRGTQPLCLSRINANCDKNPGTNYFLAHFTLTSYALLLINVRPQHEALFLACCVAAKLLAFRLSPSGARMSGCIIRRNRYSSEAQNAPKSEWGWHDGNRKDDATAGRCWLQLSKSDFSSSANKPIDYWSNFKCWLSGGSDVVIQPRQFP